MNTKLKHLKAIIEIPNEELKNSIYEEIDVNLITLYNNKEKELNLQIGFLNLKCEYQSIQLNNENLNKLKEILNNLSKDNY